MTMIEGGGTGAILVVIMLERFRGLHQHPAVAKLRNGVVWVLVLCVTSLRPFTRGAAAAALQQGPFLLRSPETFVSKQVSYRIPTRATFRDSCLPRTGGPCSGPWRFHTRSPASAAPLLLRATWGGRHRLVNWCLCLRTGQLVASNLKRVVVANLLGKMTKPSPSKRSMLARRTRTAR
jgi:hypothetical protein